MKNTLLRLSKLLLLVLTLHLTGCASLHFETLQVGFEDPVAKLHISPVEPNEEEQAGILLRFKPATGREYHFKEETTMFAQIQNGVGKQAKLTQDRTEQYTATSVPDTFKLDSKTTVQPDGGHIEEHLEVTNRGEITKLISVKNKTSLGEIRISKWTRSPIFPENKSKMGEAWNYEESMRLELKSTFIQHEKPSDLVIHAQNTLDGFAVVSGKRCAIIKTEVTQDKEEHLKVFWFQKMAIKIATKLTMTTYFDYEAGEMIARITVSDSKTELMGMSHTDTSKSQSIFYATRQ
jgi:hypothetical protein